MDLGMDVLDYEMEDGGLPPSDMQDNYADVILLDDPVPNGDVAEVPTIHDSHPNTSRPFLETIADEIADHVARRGIPRVDTSVDGKVYIKTEQSDTSFKDDTIAVAVNDSPISPKYVVVFLVESTGRLSRHIEKIKVDYLTPILRHFRDANRTYSSDSPIAGWTKDAYYGFVAFSSTDAAPGREVNCTTKPTDNEEMALKNIEKLHAASTSFQCSQQVCLLEAFAAGLHCLESIQLTYMANAQHVEKHFILLSQSEPLEELQSHSKSATSFHLNSLVDVPVVLLESHVHLSLIAPRNVPALHKLVTSCKDPTSTMETSAATDERHLVLLNGYSIRPPPPIAIKASPERVVSPVAVPPAPVVGSLLKNELMAASVSSPLSIRTPLSQQPVPSVEAITSPMPETNKPNTLQPMADLYVKTESPAVVKTSQPEIMIPSTPENMANLVKSSESPRPQLTPGSSVLAPQGSSPIPSYAAMKVNSPNVAVGSPQALPQQRLPIPIPVPNIALTPNMPGAIAGMPPGSTPLMNSVGRPPHVSVSDLYNVARTAGPDTLGRPLMGNPGMPTTSNAFAALQQNAGMLISQLSNPTSVPVPNTLPRVVNERCVVWDGLVEWVNQEAVSRVNRQINQQPCEVWVPVNDVIKAERWPPKLTIQFLPRSFSQAIHPFMNDPVKVFFHFKPTPNGDQSAIKELHEHFLRRTAGATFGCILIPNNATNPVNPLVIANMGKPNEPPLQLELRVIVFVFNVKVNHFQGWIPRDQGGFVDALRHITQATANQQRQLGQNQMQQQPVQQGIQGMNPTMQQRVMPIPQQPQQQQQAFGNPALQNMMDSSQYNNLLQQQQQQQQQSNQQQQAMQINSQQQQQQQLVNLGGYSSMYSVPGNPQMNPQTMTQEQSMRLQQQQQQQQLQQSHQQQQQAQQQHMQRFLQQQVHQQQQQQMHQQQGSATQPQDPQLRQLLQNSSPRLPGGQL